ncbi:hypothetical protein AB9C46_26200 [Klebsiella pneumoniae]
MNKSWLEQQVQNEKLKKVQEEKKDGTIQKGLYRVRIKDKYRWDLWENDFRVVIAYSKDDAELKFTEMTGFNISEYEHFSFLRFLSILDFQFLTNVMVRQSILRSHRQRPYYAC